MKLKNLFKKKKEKKYGIVIKQKIGDFTEWSTIEMESKAEASQAFKDAAAALQVYYNNESIGFITLFKGIYKPVNIYEVGITDWMEEK